ncbi:serine/threonine-protein kinase [Myxococcaceae bacterium GXIMD 01537]
MSPRQLALVPPGTDVGGYKVEKKLGAGGFGAVYLARRGGRLYALKLIPLWGLGEWAEREVAILLRLKHPNLVRIRGHGQWPDESPQSFFIAMDYVEGRRLDAWAQAENPSAREVARKVLGVARGLGVSHETRVVHRDLKEANIVVRASDGEAVLVDFGAGGYESAPSITGGVLPPGTPEYRAPEAWRFQQEHGDEPSASYQPGPSDDLYALGVVLYWLLTGRQPFLPDEAAGVEAVLHRAPRAPQELNPRVPEALGDLCLRLLAKSPEERHASAAALGEDLERLLAQADASWEVALCDAYGPDTATTLANGPLAEDDELLRWLNKAKARPRRGPLPVRAAPSPRGGARRARRAMAWASLGVFLCVCALLLARVARSVMAPARVPGVAILLPTGGSELALSFWAPGQEVAAPWLPPEAQVATAPPEAALTSVAVTASAAFSKDLTPVKMKSTGMTPQPDPRRGQGSSVAKALGVAACLGMACTGSQVRPKPPPEECPPGAAEAMKKLNLAYAGYVHRYSTFRPNDEGPNRDVNVQAGPATLLLVSASNGWGGLPRRTEFFGRILIGAERVYFRITEARTPKGERFPVCIQIVDGFDSGFGIQKRRDGGPDAATIESEVLVEVVPRFE